MTEETTPQYKSPALAWISLALAVVGWVILLASNGYVALAFGIAAAACGFFALPGRSIGARRVATTAIIASLVLVVILAAFLIVLKIALNV